MPEAPSATPIDPPRSHAGLERDGLTVVAFDSPEQLRQLLGEIGIQLDGVGRLLNQDGRGIACCSCDRDIALPDVGHVMPGSTYVYCKDPVCILDYLERFG